MILIEKQMDLFETDKKYYLVHCVSADYRLGAGIAVMLQKKFKLISKLESIGDNRYPNCIFLNPVFNLVTKKNYWDKPTYESLEDSLNIMKIMILELNKGGENVKFVAMPKIGCGLDRLSWIKVKELIKEVFIDIDIEILVCSI